MSNGNPAYGTTSGTAWQAALRGRQAADPCAEPCAPRCPACGDLRCLCRPRFFPGQLLTDQDLNRLEQYVVDKNRLHNRYVHGWGVACGLEVVCDACDPGHVVVRTGYALSPCGDDIVVCADQSVDVCALVGACEPREPACEGPYDVPPRDCTGAAKRWVLAICYDERPTRGVTAQLGAGDTPCPGACACGGSGGCGCGGSSGGRGTCGGAERGAPPKGRKAHQPHCEPTQICEGYRFVTYPAPKEERLEAPDDLGRNPDLLWTWLYANRARFGPLLERLLCCVTRALELRQTIREGRTLDRAFATSAYTEYAGALAEFAADFAVHRCKALQRVHALREHARTFDWDSPEYPDDVARAAELNTRVEALEMTWLEFVSECVCSALLPACPRPASTNCVPLAVVTLSDGACSVVEICNWSERKLLLSWPTLGYWLSWLPWDQLRDWIKRVCCAPERGGAAAALLSAIVAIVLERVQHKPEAAAAEHTVDVRRRLAAAFSARDLRSHLVGEFQRLRTEGAAPGEPAWSAVLARLSDPRVAARAAAGGDLAELGRRLASAEEALARQAQEIEALRRRRR